MKRKGILFSVLSVMCIGFAAGCNGEKGTFRIETAVNSREYGYASGSGDYKLGSSIMLKFYPNLGCKLSTVKFQKGEETSELSPSLSDEGYYYINKTLKEEDVGKYTAEFTCDTFTDDQVLDDKETKYDVKYVLYKPGTDGYEKYNASLDLANYVYFSTDGKSNEEKVASGSKISKSINYHNKLDGKIDWYTVDFTGDSTLLTDSNKYDFDKPVVANLTLYGLFNPSAITETVKDAINNLKNAEKVVIKEVEKKWNIGDRVHEGDTYSDSIVVASVGDFYIDSTNYDVLVLGMNGKWEKAYNLKEKYGYYGTSKSQWEVADERENCSGNDGDICLDTEKYNLNINDNGDWQIVEELKEPVYTTYLSGAKISAIDDKFSIVAGTYSGSGDSKAFAYTHLLKGNTYYINRGNNTIKLELNADANASGIELKDISDLYKYISIADLDVDKLKSTAKSSDDIVVSKWEGEGAAVDINGVSCARYDLKKDGSIIMTIYINKGVIYQIVTKEHTLMYDFASKDDQKFDPTVTLPMYLVRLYTNDSSLRADIKGYANNYETILKVVPGEGETLNSAMRNDAYLSKVLKEYYYELKHGENTGNSCAGSIYLESGITGHLKLCMDVKGKLADVKSALTNTGVGLQSDNTVVTGKFDVVTKTKVFDEEYTKEYSFTEELNAKPDGMNSIIWDSLSEIAKLSSVDVLFGRFEYDSVSKVYKFFEKDNSTTPYLSVMIEDDRISQVVYYKNESGKITTYTSEFDYSKYDALKTLKVIANGNYILNNSVNISEYDYFSMAAQGGINADLWEMIGFLKSLDTDITKYTYDSANNKFTFTDTDGSVYEYSFVVEKDKITEFKYSVDKDGTANDVNKEYTFNYFNETIEELINGGYLLGDVSSTVESEHSYVLVEGEETFLAPPTIVSNLLEILQKLGESGYVYNDTAKSFVITESGTTYTYVFKVSDGKVTELEYTVDTGSGDPVVTKYIFDYDAVDFANALKNTLEANNTIYIKVGSSYQLVDSISSLLEGEKPTDMSEDEWNLFKNAIEAIKNDDGNVEINFTQYSNESPKYKITSESVSYEFEIENASGTDKYFIKSITDNLNTINFYNNAYASNFLLNDIESKYIYDTSQTPILWGLKIIKVDPVKGEIDDTVIVNLDIDRVSYTLLETIDNCYKNTNIDELNNYYYSKRSFKLIEALYAIREYPNDYLINYNDEKHVVIKQESSPVIIKIYDELVYFYEGGEEFGGYKFVTNISVPSL